MRRRTVIGAMTALAVAFGILPGTPATAELPPGAVSLAPGTSSVPWTISIVGTTPTHAVYTRSVSGGGDYNPPKPPPLSVPLAGGAAEELTLPAGRLVVAGSLAISINQEDSYEWKNLTTGATGTGSGPHYGSWFGPHGATWLEQSNEDSTLHLFTENLETNQVQDLGTVPGVESVWTAQILDSPDAIVVVSRQDETIVKWSAADGFALPIPFANAELLTACPAITSGAIGCYGPNRVERIPLDGSAPIVKTSHAYDVAITPTTTAWISIDGEDLTLLTTPAAGGDAALSALTPSVMYEMDTLTANGAQLLVVAGDTVSESGIYSTTDGDNPELISRAGATPLRTYSIAITAGRVAWTDNTTEALPLRTRRVDNDGSSLRLGSTRVSAHATPSGGRLVASGRLTLYTTEGASQDLSAPQSIVHLVGNGGDTVVGAPNELGVLQISGHRILWTDNKAASKVSLHNLVTGVTSAVTGLGTAVDWPQVALWGDYVAFVKADGSVWRRNLTTRVNAQVAGPGSAQGSVLMWGDWVAWVSGWDFDNNQAIWSWKNAVAGSVQQVPYPLIDLTSDGAIVKTGQDETSYDHGAVGVLPYGATEAVPLAEDVRFDGVGVNASTAAWIDGTTREALVRALPHSTNRPRSLGNPEAPRLPDGWDWFAKIPTSAPLTTCAVQIRSGATVVQTIACHPSSMRLGIADAAWVGQDGTDGSLPPGAYTWTLVAGNADGSVLAADGSTAPITGTVYIPTQTQVTKHPSNTTVRAFERATFTAAASGIPTPSAQWLVSKDNAKTWTKIPGATSPTYSFIARGSQNGWLFLAMFDNGWTGENTIGGRLTVKRVGTAQSISRSDGTITRGQSVTVSGRLRRAGTTIGIGSARIKLYRRAHGATRWVYWKTVTTSSTGRWRQQTAPGRSTDYTARYAGTADYVRSASGNVTVVVR